MSRRRPLLASLLASLLLLGLPACGSDGGSAAPAGDADAAAPGDAAGGDAAAGDAATGPVSGLTLADLVAPGPWAVGVTTRPWVDAARATPPNGTFPGAPDRTLVTEIWYPRPPEVDPGKVVRDAAPALDGAPWPVVLHGHGFLSERTDNAELSALLASHGYVVAAPTFPLSNRLAKGGATIADAPSQPGDLRFVLDRLAAMEGDAAEPLELRVDADRVVLTGLSLGGFSALMGALHPDFRDPRVDGVATMAAVTCFVPAAAFDTALPLLLLHGTSDAIVSYAGNAVPAYDLARSPKALVTLRDGTHAGFVDVSAALFDQLDHADSLGCSAVEDAFPAEDEDALADALGGRDQAFVNADCPRPCPDPDALGIGMRTTRQVALAHAALRAFVDGVLKDDEAARAWLRVDLPLQEVDATAVSEE